VLNVIILFQALFKNLGHLLIFFVVLMEERTSPPFPDREPPSNDKLAAGFDRLAGVGVDGNQRDVGVVVIFHCIYMLKLELIAVLAQKRYKIVAVFIRHFLHLIKVIASF
jgi:hypothetical protein